MAASSQGKAPEIPRSDLPQGCGNLGARTSPFPSLFPFPRAQGVTLLSILCGLHTCLCPSQNTTHPGVSLRFGGPHTHVFSDSFCLLCVPGPQRNTPEAVCYILRGHNPKH